MSNIDLSQVWDFIVEQGGDVYVVVDDQGLDDGRKAVYIGDNGLITVDDQDGYGLCKSHNVHGLVLEGEYDHEAALKAASDLTGILAVVGVPGSIHHRWQWFSDEENDEAWGWIEMERSSIHAVNPTVGALRQDVLSAGEAFDVKHQDGTRVYFQENVTGGFKHGVQGGYYVP